MAALPAAAVGLVPAGRAAPDGVHPEHLGAAAFAEHFVGIVGRASRGEATGGRRDCSGSGHGTVL